jgi:ATP phosphoribosyltransferase regulatory subunit
LEADLETLQLALDCLKVAKVVAPSIDMADARLVDALLAGVHAERGVLSLVHEALAAKDGAELRTLTRHFPPEARQGLLALVQLYGDEQVLLEAEKVLPALPAVAQALANLKWLASHLEGTRLTFDLADLGGYAYYTGPRFSIYTPGASDALVRGGRYDAVGAVFGRNRPAAGFSLDVKALVGVLAARPLRCAIHAPWGDTAELRAAIVALRARGETVVCALPGHESEVDEFHCDRELIQVAGQWVVKSV